MEIFKTKDGNYLNYKKSYSLAEINEKIKKKEVIGISVSVEMGNDSSLKSIDFLKDIENLEYLQLDLLHKISYDVVNSLTNLKSLFIANAGKNHIEINKLINLERLVLLASENVIGVEACTRLKYLRLLPNFQENMEILKHLYDLEFLEIQEDKFHKYHLTTLDGIENVTNLSELKIRGCRKLKSIYKISNLKKLKKIEILDCKKIEDFNRIEILPELQVFNIINCSKIPSLDFIKSFPSLNELNFNGDTEIIDGNLKHIIHIKKVLYEPRNHYYKNNLQKWIKGR